MAKGLSFRSRTASILSDTASSAAIGEAIPVSSQTSVIGVDIVGSPTLGVDARIHTVPSLSHKDMCPLSTVLPGCVQS